MMQIIDNSAKTDYHTQVNNKLVPLSSCNTTSMIMFLLDNKITFPKGPYVQDEDNLTSFTLSKESLESARKLVPWFFDANGNLTVPVRQIHQMLDWCTNKWIGKDVVKFTQNMSINDIVQRLVYGQAMIVSGKFTITGHIVCLVGIEYETLDKVEKWIIDDPFGDWHTKYEDHRGNGIRFTNEEFIALTNVSGAGFKWAHYLMGESK